MIAAIENSLKATDSQPEKLKAESWANHIMADVPFERLRNERAVCQ